jgi:hypothetical protein
MSIAFRYTPPAQMTGVFCVDGFIPRLLFSQSRDTLCSPDTSVSGADDLRVSKNRPNEGEQQ